MKDTSVKHSGLVGIQPQGITEGLYASAGGTCSRNHYIVPPIAFKRSLAVCLMPLSNIMQAVTTGFIVVRRFQKSLFLEIVGFSPVKAENLSYCNFASLSRLANL